MIQHILRMHEALTSIPSTPPPRLIFYVHGFHKYHKQLIELKAEEPSTDSFLCLSPSHLFAFTVGGIWERKTAFKSVKARKPKITTVALAINRGMPVPAIPFPVSKYSNILPL